MSIRTIVVALALNGDSACIANRTIQLAEQHQARLVAVHVIESLPLRDSSRPISVDSAIFGGALAKERACQLKSLLEAAEQPVTTCIEEGKPHEIIMGLAASCGADLVVIGPGIARSMREAVFGSTADRVVRSSPCPVLVVRKDGNTPYNHIVVGVDFSEHSKAAASWASRLSPAAYRELVHAIEVPLVFEQAMLKAGTSQMEIDHYRKVRVENARRQVIKVFGENVQSSRTIDIKVVHGDAAATLLGLSYRRAADLLAIGTRGSNALAQHVLGSVARKVLLDASCDVLVVPIAAI